jgi:uncharacterized protein YndB with AHSA1/START domain
MKIDTQPAENNIMKKAVTIQAPASQVWPYLVTPELMNKWMMPDLALTIVTDWKAGSPLIMRGRMNGKDFENRGTVLQFEPERILQYSHLSSISRLPDRPESYSLITFSLKPLENQTILELTLRNFPTESIQKHLAFYWNVTLEVLKNLIEG